MPIAHRSVQKLDHVVLLKKQHYILNK